MKKEKNTTVFSEIFMYKRDIKENHPDRFYVDEVINVSTEEFEKIRQLNDSEVIKDYLTRNYGCIENARHGPLITNENNEGLLVDPQGFKYARYMFYTPNIEEYYENNYLTEINLYVPLLIHYNAHGEKWNDFSELKEINGTEYEGVIKEAIKESMSEYDKNSFAKTVRDLDTKIISAEPDVKECNGNLWGLMKIISIGELKSEEINIIKDLTSDEFCNGWGYEFENQAIAVGDGEIYIRFWNDEYDYSVETEEEFLEQDTSPNMTMM